MGTSIYDRLNEFIDRIAVGGQDALSEREKVANDVAELIYKVGAGGVVGFLYNSTDERKRDVLASVKALQMPELITLVDDMMTRQDGTALDDLDDRFLDLEEDVYDRLQEFLDEEATG